MLSVRELKIKYSRTLLGIGWFFLQPLVVVIVYSIFFKYLVHINSDNIPYPSFVFSGLVLWYLFAGIISKSTFALIESADLIHKVSFPRLIILISKIVPVILECLILLILLFVITLFSGQPPGFLALTSIFYFVQTFILSFAIGLFCSTIALKYRDIAHGIPFVINFGIWLTPVFFPLSIVPFPYKNYVFYLNPLASAIEGLRGAMFFNTGVSLTSLLMFVIYGFLLAVSFFYFIKFEKKIVENL
ncbi:MAG: ABC transporter permease [Bacteroidia bacterium]|nr:ABC transporter permease [Bacteroidia bacterium]